MRRLLTATLISSLALGLWACSDDAAAPGDSAAVTKDKGATFKDGAPQQDKGKPQPDKGKPQPDKGKPQPDTGKPQPDKGKPQPDKGPKKLSCDEIGACADACSNKCPGGLGKIGCMMKCSTDCKAKGCAAAQTAYGTLYNCVSFTCMLDCAGGPTPKCKTCVTTKCATQNKACGLAKCP